MSRETKKKPGDMQKARKNHLAKQALTDKLKVLRAELEVNKEVWFTHVDPHSKEHKRLKLRKLDWDNFFIPVSVLARVNGKLQVMFAPDKYSSGGGSIYLCNAHFTGYIPQKQVLAIVVNEHNSK